MSAQPEVIDVDAEVVALAPVSPNLLGATTGAALIEAAAERATALAEVIEKKQLFVLIKGKRHVLVQGWTLLGSMMGVYPVTDYVHELRGDDGGNLGFEARVEARTLSGAVVGAAISRCSRSEGTWASRDDYTLQSMAQTRAVSKALRMPLDFVMQLAGFEATPAEEMPGQTGPSPRTRLARLIKEQDIDVMKAKTQMALLYGGVTASADLTDEQVEDFILHLTEGLEDPGF